MVIDGKELGHSLELLIMNSKEVLPILYTYYGYILGAIGFLGPGCAPS